MVKPLFWLTLVVLSSYEVLGAWGRHDLVMVEDKLFHVGVSAMFLIGTFRNWMSGYLMRRVSMALSTRMAEMGREVRPSEDRDRRG